MFSTLISGALFALLILEAPAMVSALPTSSITTTTTITSARLKTRHASDSNRNNHNSHGNGNDNNLVPPDNTTTSEFEPPPYQSVMSSTREFATMLSLFDERDNSENSERGNHSMSPGEKLAIVIAALTLLVGIIPLLRCSRFRHWVSSSISPAVKKALSIKLPNPAPTTLEDPSAIPPPIPYSLHIHNNHFNTQLICASSNTPYATEMTSVGKAAEYHK